MLLVTKTCKKCLSSILILLIVLIGLITLPVLLTPILIIRTFVKIFAKCLKPELGEMLSGFSAMHAAWGAHSKPKRNNKQPSTTLSCIIANSQINLNKIEDIAQMLLRDEKFAKAKMILVKWMGFYFWKRISTFNLKSHLILHKTPIPHAEFLNLTDNILNDEPYDKAKPLWEIHLFSHYLPPTSSSEKCCAIAFKYHHCLADFLSARSVLDAISECLVQRNYIPTTITTTTDVSNPSQNSGKTPKNSKAYFTQAYKMILFLLKFLVFGPFELVREIIIAANTTIKKVSGLNPLKQYQSFQLCIPQKYVKGIARKNQVSSVLLTFAAFSGAYRKLLMDLNVQPLPVTVCVVTPVPLPWTRAKDLGNYYSIIHLRTLIREEDPLKRLEFVKNQFEEMKTSIKPLIFYFWYEMIGSLFYWILESCLVYGFGATSCSLAPGHEDVGKSLGLDVKSIYVAGGMPFGDLVMLGFYSAVASGEIQLRVCGDTALFKNSTCKQFIENLVKEFEILDEAGPGSEQNLNLP